MATDSTELTFVRCPSCRSLVPAVSVRCRICGATLDAAQSGHRQEEGAAKKSGRVRQRTINQQDSVVASAVDQIRHENTAPEIEAVEPAPATEKEPEENAFSSESDAGAQGKLSSDTSDSEDFASVEPGSSDDPLSAYLEEVDSGPGETADKATRSGNMQDSADEPQAEASMNEEAVPAGKEEESFAWGMNTEPEKPATEPAIDDTDSLDFVPEGVTDPGKKESSDFVSVDDPASYDDGIKEDGNIEEEKRISSGPAPDNLDEEDKYQEKASRVYSERYVEEQTRPRVLMESGNRRKFGGGGLSFGRNRGEKRDDRARHGDNRQASGKRDENRDGPKEKFGQRQERKFQSDKYSGKESGPNQQRGNNGKGDPFSGRKPVRVSSAEDNFKGRYGESDRRPGRHEEPDIRRYEPERKAEPAVENSSIREDSVTAPVFRKTPHPAPAPEMPDAEVAKPKAPMEKAAPETVDEPVAESSNISGRLSGWLVSFRNPAGTSMELRDGRFFVTRSSLKSADLVVDDPSVSVPHAMVAVKGGTVKVQDLMSDEGAWIKAAGSEKWERIDEIARVKSGDSVRFGNVEFRVVLLVS